jgi:hypothetical protein
VITAVLDGGGPRSALDDVLSVDKRKQTGAPFLTTPADLALRRIVRRVLTRPSAAAGPSQ